MQYRDEYHKSIPLDQYRSKHVPTLVSILLIFGMLHLPIVYGQAMPIQTTILTQNLELPVRFACLWTGRRTQNPHRATQGKHPESAHADLGMELTACLLVGFLCWMTTKPLCLIWEIFYFVFGLHWSTSNGPNEQLYQDPECFPRLPEEPASFSWRKSRVVVCMVWPVALRKNTCRGRKVYFCFSACIIRHFTHYINSMWPFCGNEKCLE